MTADIRVGLVGYGYWGANLARNIHASRGVRLAGIADPDERQRDNAARAYPNAKILSDLDGLLSAEEIQAVVIASPASMHGPMALKALRAGRDVLVEKPLAATVDESEELVQVANDLGRVAMVGHTFLYSPPVHQLRRYIETKELGAVQYLYSQRLSLGRIRRDCNALWNFAPHDVAIMLYLLDERPVEVSARGFSFIQPGIDDICFASLSFASGVGANIHVSWIDPRKTRLMTVVGDEKMVIYNDVSADQKLWLVDAGVARNKEFGQYESLGEFQWKTRAGDILIPQVDMSEPLRNEIEAFGDACRTRTPPLADARHGADVVRVLTAIDQSAQRNGAPVELSW
jgi:predicted dehydrogenase